MRTDWERDPGLAERISVSAVWEDTCFCAIDPGPRSADVSAMAGLLEAGERVIAVFYLDPGVEKGPLFGAGREEMEAVFEPSFRLGREEVPQGCFPSRKGREWLAEFIRKD